MYNYFNFYHRDSHSHQGTNFTTMEPSKKVFNILYIKNMDIFYFINYNLILYK